MQAQLVAAIRDESFKKAAGLTDEELMSVATKRFARVSAKWLAWESERTGFGRGFRHEMRLHASFPLAICSDHYVDHLNVIRDNEANSPLPFYLTWNKKKAAKLAAVRKGVIHTRHPWMALEARKSFAPKPTRGMLFFYPHIHANLRVEVDLDRLTSALNGLSAEYQPVTIAVSSQCIEQGVHQVLRPLGFPLTTIGNMLDPAFPELFYSLLQHFRFTGGLNVGSHVYYSLEAGVPHYLLSHRVPFELLVRTEENDRFRPHTMADDYPDEESQATQQWLVSQLQQQHQIIPSEVRTFIDEQFGKRAQTSRAKLVCIGYLALFLRPVASLQALALFRKPARRIVKIILRLAQRVRAVVQRTDIGES